MDWTNLTEDQLSYIERLEHCIGLAQLAEKRKAEKPGWDDPAWEMIAVAGDTLRSTYERMSKVREQRRLDRMVPCRRCEQPVDANPLNRGYCGPCLEARRKEIRRAHPFAHLKRIGHCADCGKSKAEHVRLTLDHEFVENI